MANGFYKMNRKVLQFDYEKDIQKIIFNHYLMRKENLNSINGNLPNSHLQLTVRTVSRDLQMSIGGVHRIIKEFEELNIIERVINGKYTKTSSIYKYNTDTKKTSSKSTDNSTFGTGSGTDFGTSKIDNINREDLNLWVSEFGR